MLCGLGRVAPGRACLPGRGGNSGGASWDLVRIAQGHSWEAHSNYSISSWSLLLTVLLLLFLFLQEISPLPVGTPVSSTWKSFRSPGRERRS